MNGQLSEHPLGELIRELSENTLSGALRVEHERSKVVTYFEHGKVVYSASNVRNFRLAEYLKKRELVNAEQLTKHTTKRSDLELASAISTAGILPQQELDAVLRSLVSDVLRFALLWTTGTWTFEERARLDEKINLQIDPSPLLLECARKTGDRAKSRFDNPLELITLGAKTPSNSDLLPAEGFLLTRAENPVTVDELVALSGLPETEALRIIYGLTLAGLLNRQRWPIALRSSVPRRPPPPPPVIPAKPAAPQRSEEDELKDFLARMDAAVSYYEVLEISPDPTAHDIKQAYYGIARKYHPDRFRGTGESPLHAQLESAFARITQAYETLMDAGRRRAYDSKLKATQKAKDLARSAPKAASTSTTETTNQPQGGGKQTESIFQEGFAALQQGQIHVAIGLLAAAARAVPDESRYRAYYGRALAAHEKTRRSAEAELQAAVRLDPQNATYRVMLSELYRDLGFARRAISEAQRALTIDPANATAREILKALE